MTSAQTSPELLKALQVRAARIAISSSSMRGRGNKGVVKAGRAFLNVLSLKHFGTSDPKEFKSALDAETLRLKNAFPTDSRFWGLARKGLNIFLRDCLYTVYLRDAYSLYLAEPSFEVPLDSLSGRALYRESGGRVSRWGTVRGLTPKLSEKYQSTASELAASTGIARVHLDVFWWGSRMNRVTH